MKNLGRVISFILCCYIFSSCTHESIEYTKCEAAVDCFDFTKEGFQVGPVICGRDTHQYAFFHRYGISSFAHWESCKYCCKEVEEPKDEKIEKLQQSIKELKSDTSLIATKLRDVLDSLKIKLEKDDEKSNGKADTCKRSH